MLGVCECPQGRDGSVCKHQYILWSFRLSKQSNFLPYLDASERQRYSKIATGGCLPLSAYEGKTVCIFSFFNKQLDYFDWSFKPFNICISTLGLHDRLCETPASFTDEMSEEPDERHESTRKLQFMSIKILHLALLDDISFAGICPRKTFRNYFLDSKVDVDVADRLKKCVEPITEKELVDSFNKATAKIIQEIKSNPHNRQLQ